MSEELRRIEPYQVSGKWIFGLWRNSWSNTVGPALNHKPTEQDWDQLTAKHLDSESEEWSLLQKHRAERFGNHHFQANSVKQSCEAIS